MADVSLLLGNVSDSTALLHICVVLLEAQSQLTGSLAAAGVRTNENWNSSM